MTLMFVHCHISVYPSRATVIELSFASRLRRFCWTRALCVWFQIEVKALYERPDPHINRQECLLKVNVQPLSFNIDQVSSSGLICYIKFYLWFFLFARN